MQLSAKHAMIRPVSVAPPQCRVIPKRTVCMLIQKNNDVQAEQPTSYMALPIASLLAAAIVGSSFVMPQEALAARSSGRAGGSSGFSARKSAPAQSRSSSMRMQAAPSVSSTTVVVAPSPFGFSPFGFSPFGFSPFGGYGYGGGVGVGIGFPVFGGLFQVLALALLASVIINVVKGFISKGGDSNDKKKDGDTWGDL